MKITQVLIENFKPFGRVYLPLEGELPEGLFIVQGPNSSGKTSLVEAILWGLWGPRTIKWVKQEQLVRKTESSCKVTLDFEVEGARYRIKREYTRGAGVTAVLFKGVEDKYVPIERNVTPVEERMDEILGMSYQEALETLFIRQGEVNRLAVASPGELRDLVRDLFGLERLEQITDVLRDKAKDLDREIRGVEKKLAVLPEKKRQKKNLEKDLKQLRKRFSNVSDLIDNLEEELGKIPPTQTLKELKELKSAIEKMEKDLQTQEKQLEQRKKEKIDTKESVDQLNKKLTDLDKRRRAVTKEKEELERTKTKIEKKESSLQVEETQLEKVQGDLHNAQNVLQEIEAAESEIDRITKQLEKKDQLEEEKAAISEKRNTLVKEFVAPENIKTQIKSAKKDITKRKRRVDRLKKKKSQLSTLEEETKKLPEIEKRWKSQNKLYLNTRDTITQLNTELDHLETSMQSVGEYKGGKCPTCLQEIKPQYAESLTKKLKEQIGEGIADLSRKKALLEELTTSVKKLETKRDEMKASATKIETLKTDVQELQEQLEELAQLNTKIEVLVDQLKHAEEASQEIDECDSRLEEIEEALRQLADRQGRLGELEKQVKKKEKIQTKLERLTPKEEKYSEECKKLKKVLSDLKKKFDEELLQKLTKELEKIEEEIKAFQKERHQLEGRLEKIAEHIQELNQNVDGLKKNVKANREQHERILESLETESLEKLLGFFEKKTLDELIQYRTRKEEQLKGKKENLESLEKQVEEKEERQEKVAEEIEKLHEEEENLKKKKKKHTHAEQLRIFVDDFVSEYVVRNKLCGALKTATTEYLTRFSTGRYSLLDIDAPTKGPYGAGVIITLKDHIDQLEKSRELLSGGDRASLGLALRMAISRLISRIRPFRSVQLKRPKVKCLIMDEPLGSLDSERRPEVVHTLMDDRAFTQIFLITHTDLLLNEDELATAHQIGVYQEGGVSKITFKPATLRS